MDNYDGPYFCNPADWEAAKRVLHVLMDREPVIGPAVSPLVGDTKKEAAAAARRVSLREDAFSSVLIPDAD